MLISASLASAQMAVEPTTLKTLETTSTSLGPTRQKPQGSSLLSASPKSNPNRPTRPVPAPEPQDMGTPRAGYNFLSFRKLSGFHYPEPPAGSGGMMKSLPPPSLENDTKIPPDIKQQHNTDVVTAGFLLPLNRTPEGRVTSFLLMRDQSLCCFGAMPRVNDYVAVKMQPGTTAPDLQDEPVLVSGRLNVGPIVEEGVLLGIYSMVGHRVETKSDLAKK